LKTAPVMATAIGAILYVALISVSLISGPNLTGEQLYEESWLEAIFALLAWFLPGLVTGSLTRSNPTFCAIALGVLTVVSTSILAVAFFGWDWGVATARATPVEFVFIFFSVLVFTYAGWKIQARFAGESGRESS